MLLELLIPYDDSWPDRFRSLQKTIVDELGTTALGVDHIGSTSIPGLASKDVIDIQVTVASLADADQWPDRIGPFVRRDHFTDHVPPGASSGPDWEKRYWSSPDPRAHLHVRVDGRANHRYALLFRDYLRTHRDAALAYQRLKYGLAGVCEDTADYADVKDPVCDLILQAAERWAQSTGWTSRINSS